MTFAQYVKAGVAGIVLLAVLFLIPNMVEWNDGSTILRIQFPNGGVSWHTTAGPKVQLGGSITTYSKAGQIQFRADKQPDGTWTNDKRLKVQFNDSGTGFVLGSVNYELPTDTTNLNELHSFYPDQDSLEARLIMPALTKSVFNTGQLMTSYESYKEKRSEMIRFVEDQMQNGTFLTQSVEQEVVDEFDPTVKKRVTIVQVRKDSQGREVRAEKGQLERFGVRAFNFAIEDFDYSETVDKQIADQQQITMRVQTAIAEAKSAEQQKLTATAQGQAQAEKIKWEQEARNSQIIAEAEGRKRAAEQDALAAASEKQAILLRAGGEAEARRLKMQADGALEQKLATWLKAQEYYAIAAKETKVSWVPGVVMGGSGGSNNNSAADWLSIMGAKAAKELSLDLGQRGN